MPLVLKFSVCLSVLIALAVSPARADETARKPFSVFKDCDTCPELVVIPPGEFMMGQEFSNPNEQPVHKVTIAYPFAIGRAEIKVGEWNACVADGVCRDFSDFTRVYPDEYPQAGPGWSLSKNYVDWLSKMTGKTYRLPSEAEWEYAARGGTQTRYWWGPGFMNNMANCAYCGPHQRVIGLTKAGYYPANPFGLFDVSGNLTEWMEDCWNPNYEGAPTDGSPWLEGDCKLRVLKGGARHYDPVDIRPGHRGRLKNYGLNGNTFGLRVVRELP